MKSEQIWPRVISTQIRSQYTTIISESLSVWRKTITRPSEVVSLQTSLLHIEIVTVASPISLTNKAWWLENLCIGSMVVNYKMRYQVMIKRWILTSPHTPDPRFVQLRVFGRETCDKTFKCLTDVGGLNRRWVRSMCGAMLIYRPRSSPRQA